MAIKSYLDQEGVQILWGKICDQDRDLLDKITANSNRISELEEEIGSPMVRYNTVDGWNQQRTLISETGVIYIYLNREVNGLTVPGIKIGNGELLINLKYIDKQYIEHMEDSTAHITAEERASWNNKVSVSIDGTREMLQFIK